MGIVNRRRTGVHRCDQVVTLCCRCRKRLRRRPGIRIRDIDTERVAGGSVARQCCICRHTQDARCQVVLRHKRASRITSDRRSRRRLRGEGHACAGDRRERTRARGRRANRAVVNRAAVDRQVVSHMGIVNRRRTGVHRCDQVVTLCCRCRKRLRRRPGIRIRDIDTERVSGRTVTRQRCIGSYTNRACRQVVLCHKRASRIASNRRGRRCLCGQGHACAGDCRERTRARGRRANRAVVDRATIDRQRIVYLRIRQTIADTSGIDGRGAGVYRRDQVVTLRTTVRQKLISGEGVAVCQVDTEGVPRSAVADERRIGENRVRSRGREEVLRDERVARIASDCRCRRRLVRYRNTCEGARATRRCANRSVVDRAGTDCQCVVDLCVGQPIADSGGVD